ncbi:MAG: hypothetical protein R6U98_28015, partial [Pirellulaceae bacterium]
MTNAPLRLAPSLTGRRAFSPFRSAFNAGRNAAGYPWLACCLLFLISGATSAQVGGGPPRIRNVYIPSDQLKVLFDDSSKGVLMPREKILALWHDAQRRDESKRSIPPADTVLTRAAYEVRLSDHEFHVTGRIRIA